MLKLSRRTPGLLGPQSPAWRAERDGPRISRSPPALTFVGLPLSGRRYLGRCASRLGGGAVGGGQGTGYAPCLLAPLRRRSRRREELAQVCAGEQAPHRPCSELESGAAEPSESPATRPGPARRRSRHSALGLGLYLCRRGAAWAAPAGVYRASIDCPRPQPPLLAHPRQSSWDPKVRPNSCRHLVLGTASGPLDRLEQEHQRPSGRRPSRAVGESGAPGPEVPTLAELSLPAA